MRTFALTLLTLISITSAALADVALTAQEDGSIVVTADGKPFTTFIPNNHNKPILYPLIGPRMTRCPKPLLLPLGEMCLQVTVGSGLPVAMICAVLKEGLPPVGSWAPGSKGTGPRAGPRPRNVTGPPARATQALTALRAPSQSVTKRLAPSLEIRATTHLSKVRGRWAVTSRLEVLGNLTPQISGPC